MTHTPGPWQFGEGNVEFRWEVNSVSVDGSLWAAVADIEANSLGSRKVTAEEARSNARLIAAAPEMLAALLAAKDELISLYEEVYPSDESDNHATAIIDKVIAVINKARGMEATT